MIELLFVLLLTVSSHNEMNEPTDLFYYTVSGDMSAEIYLHAPGCEIVEAGHWSGRYQYPYDFIPDALVWNQIAVWYKDTPAPERIYFTTRKQHLPVMGTIGYNDYITGALVPGCYTQHLPLVTRSP